MPSRTTYANPQKIMPGIFLPIANNDPVGTPRQLANRLETAAGGQTEVFSPLRIRHAQHLANDSAAMESTPDVTGNTVARLSAPRSFLPEILKRYPIGNPPKVHFRPLQRWEGIVLEVGPKSFVARLMDSRDESLVEEAEIDLEEISAEDRELIRVGAVFYWKIEYQDRPSGRQRASNMRFRRLPDWTPAQIDAARQEATRVRDLIGWR